MQIIIDTAKDNLSDVARIIEVTYGAVVVSRATLDRLDGKLQTLAETVAGTHESTSAGVAPSAAFQSPVAPAPTTIAPIDNPAFGGELPETGDKASDAKTDISGLPWDARIHSTPPTLTAKNIWRARRGVEDDIVAKVTAELRGLPAPAPVAPVAPVAPAPLALSTIGAAPAPAAVVLTPYQDLLQFLGEHTHSATNPTGRLTAEWIRDALKAMNVQEGDVTALAVAPAKEVMGIKKQIAKVLGVTL